MKFASLIFSVLLLFSLSAQAVEIKEGDLIFQETDQALKVLTKSRWTHIGIILKQGSSFVVVEAGEGVVLTPLEKFINRGINADYVIKRLAPEVGTLNRSAIRKMKNSIKTFLGKRYDFWFEWNDKVIYCSELVWKVFSQALSIKLSKPEKFSDFPLTSPEAQAMIKRLYTDMGKTVNPNEPIVSPIAIFNSPLLIQVYPAMSL